MLGAVLCCFAATGCGCHVRFASLAVKRISREILACAGGTYEVTAVPTSGLCVQKTGKMTLGEKNARLNIFAFFV